MTDAVLEIDRISKRFGATTALHDVSLTVSAGELVGIGGPAGSGPTTVIRIGAGVLAADSGRVRWRGAPIDPATRRRIGYLPARGGLYPELTVLDQLTHRAELHGFDPTEAARLGLRSLRRTPTRRLDADHRRLVALVATLLPGPELLLLDEPFADAGRSGVATMVELLREQVPEVPILLSSNDLDHIEQYCDRAAILHDGHLVASGTVGELLAAGPRLLRVDAPDAVPGWGNGVPGCRTVDVAGTRLLLELTEDADDQAVLNAALAGGPVREFTAVRRTLAERFDPTGHG